MSIKLDNIGGMQIFKRTSPVWGINKFFVKGIFFVSTKILFLLFFLNAAKVSSQTIPTCDKTLTLTTGETLVMSTHSVANNTTTCIVGDATNTLSGSMNVQYNANLILCGPMNITGSISVWPYWTTGYSYGKVYAVDFSLWSGSFAWQQGAGVQKKQLSNSCDFVAGCSPPTAESIGNAQTICYNGDPIALTSGGDGGATGFEWQDSIDGGTWTTIGGATSETYDPPSDQTVDIWYRRRGTKCSPTTEYSAYTSAIKITVNPSVDAGSIGNAQTICYNGDPATLTSTAAASDGDGSYVYEWFYSTTGGAPWVSIGSSNSETYDPGTLTADRWYKRAVTSCGETKETSAVKVTVNPSVDAGSIGTAHTTCYNGDPNLLTDETSVSGGDGTYSYNWYWSPNGTGSWTSLGVDASNYDPSSGLTADRWYKREVSSCGETKETSALKVTISLLPTVSAVLSSERCGSGTLSLQAFSSSDSIEWFSSSLGGSSIGFGSPWLTPILSSDSIFYAEAVNSDGCRSDIRTAVLAEIHALPEVNLGNDTSICTNMNITFDALVGSSWLWSNGEDSRSINVDSAATYDVVVTSSEGCIGYDTIVLSLDSLPIINLGRDTSICSVANIVLDAGASKGDDFLWVPSNEISSSITVNSVNEYSVSVTDGEGCIGRDTIVVGINNNPSVDLGIDRTICFKDSVTFDAGAGFDYLWSTGETNQTITVGSSTNYSVIITDSFACSDTDSVNLYIDSLPVVELGNDTSICADQTITFDAGGPGYNYKWLPNNESSRTISGVNIADRYSVEITDGNGCKGFDTIHLSIDTLPFIDLGPDSSLCDGDSMVLNAGSPYEYIWSPMSTTSQYVTIKEAGSYTVSITDSNGCVNTDDISVALDTIPVIDLGNDTSICQFETIMLGVPGIEGTMQWNTLDTGALILASIPGEYSVTITDANGCVGYDTLKLDLDTLPVIDLGPDTSICFGDSLFIDAQKGVSWIWNTGAVTRDLTVTSANNYRVIVTDSNECKGQDELDLTVNELPLVDLGNDTSICADSSLIIYAGNVGSEIVWNTLDTGGVLLVQNPNVYSVAVTDTNGCINYDTLLVEQDSLPIVFLGNDTSICADSTLSINANQPLAASYLWNTGQNSSSIIVDSSGNYRVAVTTTKGCVGYGELNLSINNLPLPDLGVDMNLCQGDSIIFRNTLSDVDVSWLPNYSSVDSIIVFVSGSYVIAVTDSNNCVGYDTALVTVHALPDVDLGLDRQFCEGEERVINAGNDGEIYIWNTGDSVAQINVVESGEYYVQVYNSENCSRSDTIVVVVDTVPEVNLGVDTSICNNESLELIANNNGANYIWSTGETSSSISVSQASLYWVSVTNSFNCSNSDSIVLQVNPLPNVHLGIDQSVCDYLPISLGVVEKNALSYIWNTGEITDSIQTNIPGEYYISVIDTNNCFNSDTIQLSEGLDLDVVMSADSVICIGDETTVTITSVANETGILTYDWSTGDYSDEILVGVGGEYSVLIIDEKGCWGIDTITIREQFPPSIELVADSLWMCSMEEAKETVNISAMHSGSYVEWDDGSIGESYVTEESGLFQAKVVDSFGCSAEDTITIHEYCRLVDLTLPNIFTPDGDGINDDFIPFELEWEDLDYMMANLTYINFRVYNRWGKMVFFSSGVVPRWDGFNTKGAKSPHGTYFWIVEYGDIHDRSFQNNGFVRLN